MLDLFSGTGSVSNVAKFMGFQTLSVDSNMCHSPDVCVDVREWNYTSGHYGTFDWIHMSPPCTEFSRLKTRGTRDLDTANEIAMAARNILEHFKRLNPSMVYTVENPASSLLQHQEAVKGLPVHETSYCCYGMPYQKHTKIWSNMRLSLRKCPNDCFWRREHPLNVQAAPVEMIIKIPACLCFELAAAAASALGCSRSYIPVRLRSTHAKRAAQACSPKPEIANGTHPTSKPAERKCTACETTGPTGHPYHNVKLSSTDPVLCNKCYLKARRARMKTQQQEIVPENGERPQSEANV